MKFSLTQTLKQGLLCFGLSLPLAVHAVGFGFDKNRLIIEDGRTSGSFMIQNENSTPMLIRAYVEDFNHVITKQAYARPKLFQVKANAANRIRIDINPTDLPQDRETQFWLYTKAFPGIELEKEKQDVQINFVTRLKVFYRPEGLKANIDKALKNIRWKRENGVLVAENDSPLNLTIVSLTSNGKRHRVSHVIEPFSRWTTELKVKPGNISWQSINDLGATVEYDGEIR